MHHQHILIWLMGISLTNLLLCILYITQRLEWKVLDEIYSSDRIPIKSNFLQRQVNYH